MRIFYHDKNLYLNNPFLFKEFKLSSFGLGFANSHTDKLLCLPYTSAGSMCPWGQSADGSSGV